MSKLVRSLIIALLISVAIFVTSCSIQSRNRSHALERISVGDTEQKVVAAMGQPRLREPSGRPYLRYADRACASPCVMRLWWELPLLPGIEAWSVELDSSRRVVQTAHWVLP